MLISRRIKEQNQICPPPVPSVTQKMSLPSNSGSIVVLYHQIWSRRPARRPPARLPAEPPSQLMLQASDVLQQKDRRHQTSSPVLYPPSSSSLSPRVLRQRLPSCRRFITWLITADVTPLGSRLVLLADGSGPCDRLPLPRPRERRGAPEHTRAHVPAVIYQAPARFTVTATRSCRPGGQSLAFAASHQSPRRRSAWTTRTAACLRLKSSSPTPDSRR